MSGGARKAAPREKNTVFSEAEYLVTEQPHYINGQLNPVGSYVRLPEGVKPGKKLVEVDENRKPVPVKPAAKADDKKEDKKNAGQGEF